MAARLNTPADFASGSQHGSSKQFGLLPPSMFETTSARVGAKSETSEPWRDLALATSEILQLRSENKKLRDGKEVTLHTSEPIRAHVDVRHETPVTSGTPQPSAMSAISLSHVDQIIQRQAAEVAALQQKLTQAQADHQRAELRWESENTLREARHEQQLTALQNEVITLREDHTLKLHNKSKELETCQKEKQRMVADLEAHLSGCQRKYEEERELLQSRLSQSQAHYEATISELEKQKRSKEEELQLAQHQLNQLKTYVAETETSHKSSDTWRREQENLNSKLKMREEEVAQLNQQMELVNVRLQAQNRILTLQEQYLSKVKDESLEKRKSLLLTRWREKVYSLMVQIKTSEIASKHQEHNWVLKLQDSTDRLQAVEAELNVQVAAVDDRDAQLKMANHQVATLESELTRAQDVAISLDDQTQHHAQLLQHLAQFTHGIYQKYQETLQRLTSVTTTLKAYEQRIGFASGRIYMLQGQFSRKEALMKMKYEEEPTRDKEDVPEEGPTELEALMVELRRVTEERDALVRQQQEDARLLESKVTAAKLRVEEEVQELKSNIKGLHQQLDQKNQLIDELREQLETLSAELTGVKDELSRVVDEATSAETRLQKEMESLVEQEQAKCTEALAEMEHRLNECRREQTKAVVSLRQLERATARDKERSTEHLANVEKEYKATISQLEQKLHSSDKDRNILMTTIRQEGLVGHQKAQRLPPVHSEFCEPEQTTIVKTTQPAAIPADSEPLHDVIDDLKSLTAEVMEEGDEDN